MSSLMPLFSTYEKVALHVILIPPPSTYLRTEAKHIQATVSARCTLQNHLEILRQSITEKQAGADNPNSSGAQP